MVRRALSHGGRHGSCNGWCLVMVAPVSSILGLLILYGGGVVGRWWLGGGLAGAFAGLGAVLHVGGSLGGRVAVLLLGLGGLDIY